MFTSTTRSRRRWAGWSATITMVAAGIAGTPTAFADPGQASEPPAAQPSADAAPANTGAEIAGDSAGLSQALSRDLGMSLDDFRRQGAIAEQATALQAELSHDPGFRHLLLRGNSLVVVGTGAGVSAAAQRYGASVDASLVDPHISSVNELAERYRAEVGDDGLQGVVITPNGYEIRVQDPTRARRPQAGSGQGMAAAASKSPAEFARQFQHVRVSDASAPAQGAAISDYYAGQGYSVGLYGATICSAGFPGFDGSGSPLTITAGHCALTAGSNAVYPTVSTGEPAWTGKLGSWGGATQPTLGTFTWSAFGVSPYVDRALGSDLAVISGPSASLTQRPAVMSWQSSGNAQEPTANPVHVTGTATAVLNQAVCRSGRTTGWHCGHIDQLGEIEVLGDSAGSKRARVWSAISYGILADHGDSGGSWIVGNKAIGVTSAVGCDGDCKAPPYDWGTAAILVGPAEGPANTRSTLQQQRPDVSVKIWLNSPRLGSDIRVWAPGATISGVVPADANDTLASGTTVRVSTSTGWTATVPVARDGSFSIAYNGRQLGAGDSVTVTTANGFSRSAATTITSSGPTPIQQRYAQLGGTSGRLGAPQGGEVCGIKNNGCYQRYAGGVIYWSPTTGAHALWGAIGARYAALNFENSRLGLPTGDETCGIKNGGCYQTFEGGLIYWSEPTGAWENWGAIRDRYVALTSEHGKLGMPTSAINCGIKNGGCYQTFEGGTVYWSSATGAWETNGAIRGRYAALGYEHSALGLPTSAEACGIKNGGCYQAFERGVIVWSPGTGAWENLGAIRERYAALGFEQGTMGYPTGPEACGIKNGGCYQMFERGVIVWSPGTGAWENLGAIRERYGRTGFERGPLGFPTSGENCGIKNGGCYQMYEGGAMYWSGSTGAWENWGRVRSAYTALGSEHSSYGMPTGPVECGDSCSQRYEGGTLTA